MEANETLPPMDRCMELGWLAIVKMTVQQLLIEEKIELTPRDTGGRRSATHLFLNESSEC